MKSRILFAALALALVFSSSALSQEQEMKKEAKKTMEHGAMGKSEVAPLKSYACPDPCNFQINSRDEKELTEAVMAHVKKHHNMTMTPKELMAGTKVIMPMGDKK